MRVTNRYVTVWEMDNRLARLDALLDTMARQIDDHERWHRDMLIKSGDTGDSMRWASRALLVAVIAAIASAASAVAAFLH